MAIVYRLTNKANGKRYIGRTCGTLRARLYGHVYGAKTNSGASDFHRDLFHVGVGGFHVEVLSIVADEDVCAQERRMIDEMKPEYNAKNGASGQQPKRKNRVVIDNHVVDIDGEIWRSVLGFEELYAVSNFGRVKSLPGVIRRSIYGESRKTSRLIKLVMRRKRPVVYLSNKGRRKTISVSRLVAEAFIGCVAGKCVLHTDDDPMNNHISNLTIGTQADNMRDAALRKRLWYGERHLRAKLNDVVVRNIRKWRGVLTHRELGELLGISHTTVYQVQNGKTWRHVI